jgi:hypothetical protein
MVFEHIFCCIFLTTSSFEQFYFLRSCPIFEESSVDGFTNYSGFPWVCSFLAKNLVF